MCKQESEIIIVDDDLGHFELIRRNLRRTGIGNPIVSITSGNDALDYVFCRGKHAGRTSGTEIVMLLDINMPGGMDGLEVLRQIKNDARTKRLPVVMLTTADDRREIDFCYELGCKVYVTKPADPSALIDAIQRVGLLFSIVSIPSIEEVSS